MSKKGVGVFIFRRDLRVIDNQGLLNLAKKCKKIVPIFVFSPEQIISNPYRSANSIRFMIESLRELNIALSDTLRCYQGNDVEIIKKIVESEDISVVGFNRDWTPYAIERDSRIVKLCQQLSIECLASEDYTLFPMGTLLKHDKSVYQVFGAFRRYAETQLDSVSKPNNSKIASTMWVKNSDNTLTLEHVQEELLKYYQKDLSEKPLVTGGRKHALKNLELIKTRKFVDYSTKRDSLSYNTTHMSSYLKFGNVSIREMYRACKKGLPSDSGLFTQLLWKEFYVYLAHYCPRVLQGKSLKENNRSLNIFFYYPI